MVFPTFTLKPYSVMPTSQGADTALRVDSGRVIAFNVNVARITQDPFATLMLSQLIYWTRYGSETVVKNDGWIFKTRDQWALETHLTRAEQESARSLLFEMGLLEQALFGHPAQLAFRLNLPILALQLASVLNVPCPVLDLDGLRIHDKRDKRACQVKRLLGNSFGYVCALGVLGVAPAIYLSKALSIQRRVGHDDWFRLDPKAVEVHTGLTYAQQRNCRSLLVTNGLMTEARMSYPRIQNCTRVNTDALMALIEEKRTALPCEIQPTGAQVDTFSKRATCGSFAKSVYLGDQVSATGVFTPASWSDSTAQFAGFSTPVGWISQGKLAQNNAFLYMTRAHADTRMITRIPDYKKTTTAAVCAKSDDALVNEPVVVSSDLVFPEGLTAWEQDQAVKVLKGLRSSDQQDLLDEMSPRLNAGGVGSPVAYLRSLVRMHKHGQLILEHAGSVRAHRQALMEHARRLSSLGDANSGGHHPPPVCADLARNDPQASGLWAEVLRELATSIPSAQIATWLTPLAVSIDGCTLVLSTASRFKVDHIRSAYADQISRALASLGGEVQAMKLVTTATHSNPGHEAQQ
jgi:hypothetical protein